VLEDHADPLACRAQRRIWQGSHIRITDEDASAAGPLQQIDQPYKCRFSRAGMPDDAKHLAIGNLEVERFERRDILAIDAVGLVDISKANHGKSRAVARTRILCQRVGIGLK
jgi:hypothetical protein